MMRYICRYWFNKKIRYKNIENPYKSLNLNSETYLTIIGTMKTDVNISVNAIFA